MAHDILICQNKVCFHHIFTGVNHEVLSYINELVGATIISHKPISGGDISKAYFVETKDQRFFIKVNDNKEAKHMFQLERKALEEIANTSSINTPQVYFCDTVFGTSFIVMEFIESKRGNDQEMRKFGEQLAALHGISQDSFGWSDDNYIGSLFQSNKSHHSWSQFYIHERLLPQIRLAVENRHLKTDDLPDENVLLQRCETLFGGVAPSLIHGDLWSGNYLISVNGEPYLIDPATYYGHGEVDIAMSNLFGNFGNTFYDAYHEFLPTTKGHDRRMDIYQLYFLLVHLNLFGSSYYASVKRLLKVFA